MNGKLLADRTVYFLTLYSYHLIECLTEQVLQKYI